MNKKRFLFLIACLSVLSLSLHAQGKAVSSKSYTAQFGVKAGLNVAGISNGSADINFSPGMKAGFHIGALANFHFGFRNEGSPAGTGIFGIQPELLFSSQGFSFDGDSYSFNYLTLPIMLKLYVTNEFNLEIGPYFGYLVGVSPDFALIDRANIDLSSFTGGLDTGLGIGAGYQMKSGLTIGARYLLGLSNMSNDYEWKNNVISVSVGWLF